MTEKGNENEMTMVVGGELEVDHVIERKLTVAEKGPIKSLKIEIEEIDQIIEINEKDQKNEKMILKNG